MRYGFDFLGQNVRKYNGKLMIKPARKGVKAFLRDVRKTIRKHLGLSTVSMIGQLNPKIRACKGALCRDHFESNIPMHGTMS